MKTLKKSKMKNIGLLLNFYENALHELMFQMKNLFADLDADHYRDYPKIHAMRPHCNCKIMSC